MWDSKSTMGTLETLSKLMTGAWQKAHTWAGEAAMESGLNVTAGQDLQGHPALYTTPLYCQWEHQPKDLHLQLKDFRQHNLLYHKHSILLSQQTSPSRLERRTVWISNPVIGIFFQETGDASLKHLWVWRSPGFWASGLAIHGHIHILPQFQFQAKPAPFYPWEVWKGLRWLIQWAAWTAFQHPASDAELPHWAIQGMNTTSLSTCPGVFSSHKEVTLGMIWNMAVDFSGSPTRKACSESGLGAFFPLSVGSLTTPVEKV